MFQDNNKNPYYNDSLFIDNNDNKNDNKNEIKYRWNCQNKIIQTTLN